MGDERFYPEERPVREVGVGGFWIDERPVTVAEFRRFVKQTGHVTVAERALDPADYPGGRPGATDAGSLVFRPTRGPVDLSDVSNWWEYVPGANWRRPEGSGSDTYSRAFSHVSGDAKDGVWQATGTIPQDAPPGSWVYVSEIHDSSNNVRPRRGSRCTSRGAAVATATGGLDVSGQWTGTLTVPSDSSDGPYFVPRGA